jgi:hypothetical protein
MSDFGVVDTFLKEDLSSASRGAIVDFVDTIRLVVWDSEANSCSVATTVGGEYTNCMLKILGRDSIVGGRAGEGRLCPALCEKCRAFISNRSANLVVSLPPVM